MAADSGEAFFWMCVAVGCIAVATAFVFVIFFGSESPRTFRDVPGGARRARPHTRPGPAAPWHVRFWYEVRRLWSFHQAKRKANR
jgi:hypothetical protein